MINLNMSDFIVLGVVVGILIVGGLLIFSGDKFLAWFGVFFAIVAVFIGGYIVTYEVKNNQPLNEVFNQAEVSMTE